MRSTREKLTVCGLIISAFAFLYFGLSTVWLQVQIKHLRLERNYLEHQIGEKKYELRTLRSGSSYSGVLKQNLKTNDSDFPPISQHTGTIWPSPKFRNKSEIFNNIKLNFIQPDDFHDCNGTITSATNRYQRIYDLFIANSGINDEKMEVREVKIQVNKCELWPSLEMNEKYELSVKNGQPLIVAESEWGVLRGLETLVQIAEVLDNEIGIYDQEITDQPAFPYRGLLLDTSRHFIPISVIKSILTALSLVSD